MAFFVEPLLKQRLWHWLETQGMTVDAEVDLGTGRIDLVAEMPDGEVWGIELKAGGSLMSTTTQLRRYLESGYLDKLFYADYKTDAWSLDGADDPPTDRGHIARIGSQLGRGVKDGDYTRDDVFTALDRAFDHDYLHHSDGPQWSLRKYIAFRIKSRIGNSSITIDGSGFVGGRFISGVFLLFALNGQRSAVNSGIDTVALAVASFDNFDEDVGGLCGLTNNFDSGQFDVRRTSMDVALDIDGVKRDLVSISADDGILIQNEFIGIRCASERRCVPVFDGWYDLIPIDTVRSTREAHRCCRRSIVIYSGVVHDHGWALLGTRDEGSCTGKRPEDDHNECNRLETLIHCPPSNRTFDTMSWL
jgi:hypothetical protein